jgi:peptidoglycan/xylan/chitin deacetylase (PgdA/CDA1 family)
VLAFHGVDDPEVFETLMDRVRRQYHPISVDELDRAINSGIDLPDRSVLITFDDGHRSVLEHGLPILVARGLPAVAFIVAGLLSTNKAFWWTAAVDLLAAGGRLTGHESLSESELIRHLKQVPNEHRIRAMTELEQSAGRPPAPQSQLKTQELGKLLSGGVAIGNHTWSHPCLNRCDPDTISDEIEQAHTSLSGALGASPRWFAYPNGDWAPEAETMLADLGYRLGFLFDHRLADVDADPLRVSRLRVNSDTTPDRFAIILSGLHPAIHRVRGRN